MRVDHTHNDDVEVLGEVVRQRAARHLLLAHAVESVVLLALLHRSRWHTLHAFSLYLHTEKHTVSHLLTTKINSFLYLALTHGTNDIIRITMKLPSGNIFM